MVAMIFSYKRPCVCVCVCVCSVCVFFIRGMCAIKMCIMSTSVCVCVCVCVCIYTPLHAYSCTVYIYKRYKSLRSVQCIHVAVLYIYTLHEAT